MPLIWGANTEAQVVTSWRQLIMYIVKYVMKAEKPSDAFNRIAKELLQKEGEDVPVRKLFSRLLINALDRDKSRAECFLIVLIGEYVQYSQKFQWVNLNGNKHLKASVNSEDDSAMEAVDWVHIYAEREENENYKQLCNDYPSKFKWPYHPKFLSLRNFVTYFSTKWIIKDTITFPVFSPIQKFQIKRTHSSYENWCKYILLSEKPGCYITNVGNGFVSFEEELRDFVLHSKFCHSLIKQDFEDSQKEIESEIINDEIDDPLMASPFQNPNEEEIIPTQFQMHQLYGDMEQEKERDDDDVTSEYDDEEFTIDAQKYDWTSGETDLHEHMSKEELDSAPNWLEKVKTQDVAKPLQRDDVDYSKCNVEQKAFCKYISDWIRQKCENDNFDPIYFILSGRAGCGKSYAVKVVKKFLHDNHCESGFLKIAAPTRVAAFLIKGSTLHSLLKLPIKFSYKDDIPPLQGANLHQLQQAFANTKILFIDEMSMVGQHTLYQISKRLQEAKPHKSTIPFGGVSIVLMGDFAQLPPVTDSTLFKDKASSNYQLKGWKLYKTLFKHSLNLTKSMRQQGEDQNLFRNILNSIANGTFNEESCSTLKYHTFDTHLQDPNDNFEDAVKLCARNHDAKKYNVQKIKDLQMPIAPIKAVNSSSKARTAPANKAGGLHNSIIICKDSKVMLLQNLWSDHGLTNGANGFVKYIVYKDGIQPPKLPSFVLVYFPQYTGPSFHPSEEKLVPIVPVLRNWYESKTEHHRTMLPLIPSYAITIHKSQGQTLDKIIVNLGDREFASGLTYTALSRTTKLQNIKFDPFPIKERMLNIFKKENFKKRLKEENRLASLSIL